MVCAIRRVYIFVVSSFFLVLLAPMAWADQCRDYGEIEGNWLGLIDTKEGTQFTAVSDSI